MAAHGLAGMVRGCVTFCSHRRHDERRYLAAVSHIAGRSRTRRPCLRGRQWRQAHGQINDLERIVWCEEGRISSQKHYIVGSRANLVKRLPLCRDCHAVASGILTGRLILFPSLSCFPGLRRPYVEICLYSFISFMLTPSAQ